MINTIAKIGCTNPNAKRLDELDYRYYAATNRLEYIDDAVPQGNWTTDIDDHGAGNYTYDAIGNLTKDEKEKIKQIEWTVYGKVKRIIHFNKNDPTLNFTYDAQGNRAIKAIIFPSLILVPGMGGPTLTKPNPNNVTTFYVRDASGNIMAIYEKKFMQNNFEYRLVETPFYGSDRLGGYKPALLVKTKNPVTGVETLTPPPVNQTIFTRTLKKQYEMKDHLGSVRAVLSDKKFATITGGVPVDFVGEILSVSNTYPGGFLEVGRNYNTTQSRFGYSSYESIDEVYGTDNFYDMGVRLYDPRTMRPPSPDAKRDSFPELSPYQYAGNTPIWAFDLDGLEPAIYTQYGSTLASSTLQRNLSEDEVKALIQQAGPINPKAGWELQTIAIGAGFVLPVLRFGYIMTGVPAATETAITGYAVETMVILIPTVYQAGSQLLPGGGVQSSTFPGQLLEAGGQEKAAAFVETFFSGKQIIKTGIPKTPVETFQTGVSAKSVVENVTTIIEKKEEQ
ncbi:MAG: hypothetical protein HYY40_11285 [Bacteroidetes bacterium]|nr:hypothetical protein [Bacteroidota bacterium]